MKKTSLTVVAVALSTVFATSANAGFIDETIEKVKSVLGLSKPVAPPPVIMPSAEPPAEAPVEGAPVQEAPDLLAQPAVGDTTDKKTDAKPSDKPKEKVAADAGIYDDIGINPFTGKPLTVEQRQRRLDVLKMDTQYIEEKIKQEGLKYELEALPVRKAAELAAMKGLANPSMSANPAPVAASVPQAPKKIKRSKPVGEPTAMAPTVVTPVVAAPPEPRYELVSVFGGPTKSAIISVDGRSLSVKDGQNTEFGKVSIQGSDSVVIGAKTVTMRQGVNRVFVSSAESVPTQNNIGQMAAPVQQPVAAAPANPGGFVPSLPPLPLR